MKKTASLMLLVAVAWQAGQTNAEGVKDCDKALVLATYNSTDSRLLDWRLAEQISESHYKEVKTKAGLDAVIYGVPIGADWDQFRKNIDSYRRSQNQSLTEQTFRNVAWTGLDANAARAYVECLRLAAPGKNLLFVPTSATEKDITFDLQYRVIGSAKNPMAIKWSGVAPEGSKLPARVVGGSNPVLVRRPKAESTLIASGSGLSDSVVITPLPRRLSLEQRWALKCEIAKTPDPLPELQAGEATTWACPRLQAGTYEVRVHIDPRGARSHQTNQVRVGYTLELAVHSGGKQNLQKLRDGQLDIGFDGGIGRAFTSSGQNVTLKNGDLVQVRLTVSAVADKCCWHTTSQKDGYVFLPKDVQINLTKL
jgi:hypothetical protein